MASEEKAQARAAKQQARLAKQNERLAAYQAKQQDKQPRPRRRLFPESWGKYAVPLVIIVWLVLTLSGSVSVNYADDGFEVKAFVKSETIKYDNITSVEYYSAAESGVFDQGRMYGFFSLDTIRLKAGAFSRSKLLQRDEFSGMATYQLYSESRYKGDYVIFVVYDELTEADTLYAVGAKTIDVQELYDTIKQRAGL